MNHDIRFAIILGTILCFTQSFSQNIAINTTGATASTSAGLDVDFTNKGLLIPRVALTSASDAATISTPATSLLVYNLGTGGLSPAGYYYNSGTSGSPAWVQLLNGGSPGTSWLLSGNTSTSGATDYVGTTDAQPLAFRTVALERMRLQTNGTLKFTGTSTTSPAIWMESTVTDAAGGIDGILSRGTLTPTANNIWMAPFITNLGTVNSGTYTGLTFYGGLFDIAGWTKSGTGTIANGFGLYVTAPVFATSNYAAIFTGGNVGVGTASPTSELEVVSTVSTMPRGIASTEYSNGVLSDAHLWLRKARGTEAAPTAILAGDEIGFVKFRGYGTSFSTSDQTEIGAVAAENFSGTANGSYLKFMTTPNTTTAGAERMRIDQNGYVGIGTTSPSYPLDVTGIIRSSGTGFGGGLFLRNTTAVTGGLYSVYSNNAGQFVIGDENLAVAKFGMNAGLTGNAFITNIGNFGIGTAGPNDKLEVNGGNILITNSVAYNGMLYSGDANWGFKIQHTNAVDDYNVRMSYYPASGTRKAGIYNANASTWVLYSDHNATPNIIMNNVTSVGIGTTTPDPNAALDIEKTTNRILGLFGNTNAITATDGVSQSGVSVQARFSPSASTTGVSDYNAYVDLAPPVGVTITNAYGLQVRGTQAGAGTVTNGYGVYVDMNPGFGTNKYAGIFLNGNVGIGTATPCTNLEVIGNIRASGSIYGNWAGSSACPSDLRYKKDIRPLQNSLTGILKLQGVNYFLKVNEFPDKFFSPDKQIGLIAQDVEKVFPDLVITDKDGYKAVDYTRLAPILIEALKEQQKIIDSQKKEIELLNNKFSGLESMVKTLQIQINSTVEK